jgi:hypothetical protein
MVTGALFESPRTKSLNYLYHFQEFMKELRKNADLPVSPNHHHHYQPINVPTAGVKAFQMDYPQGEQAITYHGSPVRSGGCLRLQIQPGTTA